MLIHGMALNKEPVVCFCSSSPCLPSMRHGEKTHQPPRWSYTLDCNNCIKKVYYQEPGRGLFPKHE